MMSDKAFASFEQFCETPGEPLSPQDMADIGYNLLCVGLARLPEAERERLLAGLNVRRAVERLASLEPKTKAPGSLH